MDYDVLPPAPCLTPPPEMIFDDGIEKNGIVNNGEQRRGISSSPNTPVDTQATKTYNKELKMACFKLVKKPGRGKDMNMYVNIKFFCVVTYF